MFCDYEHCDICSAQDGQSLDGQCKRKGWEVEIKTHQDHHIKTKKIKKGEIKGIWWLAEKCQWISWVLHAHAATHTRKYARTLKNERLQPKKNEQSNNNNQLANTFVLVIFCNTLRALWYCRCSLLMHLNATSIVFARILRISFETSEWSLVNDILFLC